MSECNSTTSYVTSNLEQTVSQMEEEIRNLQVELEEVKTVRAQCKPLMANPTGIFFGAGEPGLSDRGDVSTELESMKSLNRELRDELEDHKSNAEDMTAQMEGYRGKYLQAQQLVEEQHCLVEKLKNENVAIHDNIEEEIQRIKVFFHDKIQELSPLVYLLESAELKHQETAVAMEALEKTIGSLTMDLARCKEHETKLLNDLSDVKGVHDDVLGENGVLKSRIQDLEVKCNALTLENDQFKTSLMAAQAVKRQLEARLSEARSFITSCEATQEECSRRVTRAKERSDAQKKALQERVAGIEEELSQSRERTRAVLQEKDALKKNLQAQVDFLVEQFNEARLEVETLRGHVAMVKAYSGDLEDGHSDALIRYADVGF